MKGVCLKFGVLACVAAIGGCRTDQTRLPTLGWGDTKAEARSYNYVDPLAEQENGPFVERPRGFDRQRTEPRRTQQHFEQTREMISPTGAQSQAESAARYPESVTP